VKYKAVEHSAAVKLQWHQSDAIVKRNGETPVRTAERRERRAYNKLTNGNFLQ